MARVSCGAGVGSTGWLAVAVAGGTATLPLTGSAVTLAVLLTCPAVASVALSV